MKKLIVIAVLLSGCTSVQQEQRYRQQKTNNRIVVVIEGCEYFAIHTYNSEEDVLTHKGNCKNPIHYTQTSGK